MSLSTYWNVLDKVFVFYVGSPKFDVVRNVEITSYTPKVDRNGRSINHPEVRKLSYSELHGKTIMGHYLEIHKKATWCDICQEIVWGGYSHALRCQCK